jgi:hypothetical protein
VLQPATFTFGINANAKVLGATSKSTLFFGQFTIKITLLINQHVFPGSLYIKVGDKTFFMFSLHLGPTF